MIPDMPLTEFSRVADQMVLKMILRSRMAAEMAQYKAQSLAKKKALAFNSLNSVSRKRSQPVGKDSLEQVKPQKLQKRDEEDDLTKWARAEREAAEQLIKELDEIINAEQKDFPIQPLQEMSFDELINEIDDILRENSEQTSLGQTTKQEVNVEKPTFTSDDSYTANKPLLQRPTTIQPDIAEQISHDTPELPKPTVETSSGIPFLNQTKHLSFEQVCHDASEMPEPTVETSTGVPFLKNHELIDQVRNTQQQEFIEEPRCLSIEKPTKSVAAEALRSYLLTRRVDSQQRLDAYQKQTTSNVISSFQVLQQQSTYKSNAHDQPTFQAVSMPALQQTAERQSFTPRYISICFSSGAHEQPMSKAVSMPAMQPPVKMQQPRYIPAHFSSGACVKPIKKRVPVMYVPDVNRPPTIHHSLNIIPPGKRPPTIDNSLNIPATNHAASTYSGAVDARKRKATQDQDEAPKPKKKFRLIPVGFP